jgi:hypothetical protein
MFSNALVFFTAALAAVTSVSANHAVSFVNNCGVSVVFITFSRPV